MTFGRAILVGMGLAIGATIVGVVPFALVALISRVGTAACPECGASLPTETACASCGAPLRLQALRVRALGKARSYLAAGETSLA